MFCSRIKTVGAFYAVTRSRARDLDAGRPNVAFVRGTHIIIILQQFSILASLQGIHCHGGFFRESACRERKNPSHLQLQRSFARPENGGHDPFPPKLLLWLCLYLCRCTTRLQTWSYEIYFYDTCVSDVLQSPRTNIAPFSRTVRQFIVNRATLKQ